MMAERLYSLDVLRGLDMFLLTVVGPLVMAANKSWECFPPEFIQQFEHGWVGFRFWDIIQPLFIFMSGAAIPFALEKRLAAGPRVFWEHVVCRVALLWFLAFFGELALTAYFVPRFFGKAMNEVGLACCYGIIARLPPSANAFVSCLFSIFVMVAVMFLWRRVKLGARLDR